MSGIYVLYERWLFPSFVPFVPERMPAGLQLIAQAFSLLWMLAFFWLSLVSRGKVRLVYLVVLALSVSAEYGAYYSVGRFSIAEDYDMTLRLLDPRLYFNAAVIYTGSFLPSALPVLGYAACLTGLRRRRSAGWRPLAGLMIVLFVSYSSLVPFSSGVFRTPSLTASLRTWTFLTWKIAGLYRGPRLDVPPASREAPLNNIVFIVDESVRGDHLSLNGYDRPTTPYLEALEHQGVLYNWPDSASLATSSVHSNTLLLTGISQLPDATQNTRKMPTIFAYAKAMGYRTALLDAQMNTRWLMRAEDYALVDERLTEVDFSQAAEYDLDLEAARWIAAKLHSSTGNFIWINKMGPHFPYGTRYPEEAAVWQPAEVGVAYDPSRQVELVNTYDNAIAYNLEGFFQTIVDPETLANTIFVYTADHGQTLSENGETWPHTGSTHNEAQVPILIISAQPLHVDSGFKASHQNLFATLLDLMGVPLASRVYPYAPSLFQATAGSSRPRFYIVGDITNALRSAIYLYDDQQSNTDQQMSFRKR